MCLTDMLLLVVFTAVNIAIGAGTEDAGYNVIAIPLAAGVLAPVGIVLAVGAILMSISTIVVALNAQLLRRLDLRSA